MLPQLDCVIAFPTQHENNAVLIEFVEVSMATTKGHRLRRRRWALPNVSALRLAQKGWRLTPLRRVSGVGRIV